MMLVVFPQQRCEQIHVEYEGHRVWLSIALTGRSLMAPADSRNHCNKRKAFGKIGGASSRMLGVNVQGKIESLNPPSSEKLEATFALALTTAFVVSGPVIN